MKKIIYHGSINIIKEPIYGYGKKYNDYGLGFYCTENIELAKEWAVNKYKDGYVNIYELDISDLKILNLNDKRYNVLRWLTILLKNREFDLRSSLSKKAKEYLIKNYSVDNIKYIGNETAYNNIYYVLKNIRDLTARKYYFDHKHEIESNDIFIMDLIRGINYEI